MLEVTEPILKRYGGPPVPKVIILIMVPVLQQGHLSISIKNKWVCIFQKKQYSLHRWVNIRQIVSPIAKFLNPDSDQIGGSA